MKLEDCKNRLVRYIQGPDSRVRFVNVSNPADMRAIIEHLNVSGNTFLTPKDFSRPDGNLQLPELYQHLQSASGVRVLRGFTSQMALSGTEALRQMLRTLAGFSSAHCKVIVLCYQCRDELAFADSRLRGLVYDIEGETMPRGTLSLIGRDFPAAGKITDGIENAGLLLEEGLPLVRIRTEKKADSYAQSLWAIEERRDTFDALCAMDAVSQGLERSWGTEEQWAYALQELSATGGWSALVQKKFGGNLELAIHFWKDAEEQDRWLYFVALKLLGCGNEYLQLAVNAADSEEQLVGKVYCRLADADWQDAGFARLYAQRKALLSQMELKEDKELFGYLQLIGMHAENGIRYLTDATLPEQQKVLEYLAKYTYDRAELLQILKVVYPDLAAYLSVCPFTEGEWLGQYFEEYRFSKATNHITDALQQMAEQQAKDRQYNLLPARSSKLSEINRDHAFMYWIDALGVEFMGFIREKCRQYGLTLKSSACCCELPSLTVFNKEFLAEFDESQWTKVSELDDIKHHGKEDYDYQKSKLPIHLCRELQIIDEVLQKARTKLLSEQCKRVLILSDHGATRMAVIKEEDIQLDVNSKGTHGGRVCEYTDEIAQIPCAVRKDDWYILANYDRFRGCQRASVEVHGGATLEEVVVPVIQLTIVPAGVEIRGPEKPVEWNFKRDPVLKIYSATKLEQPRLLMGGAWIEAQPDSDGHTISFVLPKKKGDFTVSVYDGDTELKDDLQFTMKNQVGGMNKGKGGIL